MAGIHVSGGTYSGSGDVTIDYFKADNDPYYVWLPDGTMTITSELGSHCFNAVWPGSQDYWHHQSGTVKVTTPAGTLFNGIPVNADSSGRVGQFYNIEVNQNGYGASLDQVTFSSATEGGHLKLGGNLTITSGTFATTSNPADAGELYEIVGGLILKTSGSFIQGWSGDAGFPVGFQYNGYGDLKVGYIEGQDYNGGDGVQLVLSSGNTTINSSGPSDRGFVFHDQRAGHVFHSSGTVRFEPGAGVTQKLRWSTDGLAIYNAVVSGGASSFVKGFMSGADYLTFTNDLTIDAGTIGTYGDKLRVTGNVVINDGTLDTNTTNGTTTPHTMGSLYIKSDGIYNATAYETLINKINGDSYKFRNEDGTFTHNNGTVTLDLSTNGGFYKNTGSAGKYLYNLIVKNDTTSARVSQHIGDVTVSNNLIVSGAGSDAASWDAGFYNAGDGNIIASGAATVINGAKLSRSIQNGTFGTLTIGAKGLYDAGPTTTITTGSLTDNDTFTHNNGEVVMQSSGGDLDGASTTTFYDLTSENFIDVTKSINVENTMKALGSNSWRFVTNQTIKMGTSTGSGRIEVGTASGKGMRFTNLNKTYKFEAANEAHPWIGISSGAGWNNGEPGNTIELTGCDMQFAFNTQGSGGDEAVTWKVANAEFDAVTVDSGDALIVSSGQRVAFGGTVTIPADGIIVSGALVEMKGAGNWSETGYQQHIGRATAALMWNSTGYYSPNGGYLNNGWKDVFWNADARINQDGPFRNSNLIVAKQFSASNRPIGSTSESQMLKSIRVLNGGTVSSSTNLFKIQNTGTFSTRGGLFASSSAVFTDGVKGVSSQYVQAATFSDLNSATASTMEVWFKIDNTKPMDQAGIINPLGTNRMQITVSSNPVSASGNYRLGFEWENGGTEIWNSGKVQDWDDTKWHHAAMTFDDTDGYKLYFDGKLEASGPALGNSAGSTVVANPTVMVGGQSDYGYINRAFAGTIARASIWDTELSAAQIRKMMFEDFDTATTTNCVLWWQFDEGEGGTVVDRSGQGNTGTLSGTATNASWATAGNWNANTLSGAAHTGKLYIGTGANPTVFTNSTFELANRELIVGSKFASKSHKGTTEYYIATSGTNDYLNYQKLEEVAPIGTVSDVNILANGSHRSYFNFDSNANNEQCNTLVNAGYIRIITNADFYTQDFDNSQGEWIRNATYGGTIHDDGSTPHEYEPIDIMDDQDSNFDTSELID